MIIAYYSLNSQLGITFWSGFFFIEKTSKGWNRLDCAVYVWEPVRIL